MVLSSETIEAVRRQVSIVSVVGDRVSLQRRGPVYKGLCPFHKEKTPSFNVNPELGRYYCFGCHAKGDVFSFVRELEGLSFSEAVRELAERAGIEVKETGSSQERQQEAEARRRRQELYDACSVAADYFERALREHPLARFAHEELERRQLVEGTIANVEETLRAFRVGYAPYGWSGLVEHLRSRHFNLRAAEQVGLIGQRKSGGGHYDRFRHRLMFGVVDLRGRVVAFSGRSLDEPKPEQLAECQLSSSAGAEPPPKYYNSPESTIYRKREEVFGLYQARQAIRAAESAVLVEGNFDVVSLHARGIANVVAPLGTAFTAEQAGQIARYSSKVVFLFDGDSAGARATEAAREPCAKQGLAPRVATLPPGKDPDDLIRQGGKVAVEKVLGGAKPLLEHLIESALASGFAATDAHARAAKIRQVGELISGETDPVVRTMAERYADQVAGRLGIIAGQDIRGFRQFQRALQTASAKPGDGAAVPVRVAPPERARSRSRVAAIAEQIVGAALEYPALLEDPALSASLDSLEGALAECIAGIRRLWREAQGCEGGGDSVRLPGDPAEIAEAFPEEYRNFVVGRLTVPVLPTELSAAAELRDNLAKADRLASKRHQAGVVQDLLKASASGDTDSEISLLERQLARARARHGLT